MIEMEKVGNILKLLSVGNPKRITLDLSEDGTFYTTKIFVDIVDGDKEYEGYIECRSKIPSFVENYSLVYNRDGDDTPVFTLTILD